MSTHPERVFLQLYEVLGMDWSSCSSVLQLFASEVRKPVYPGIRDFPLIFSRMYVSSCQNTAPLYAEIMGAM